MLRSVLRWACQLSVLLVLAAAWLEAQPNRIGGKIERSRVTALAGHVHPLARPEFDRGAAAASVDLHSLTLFFSKSPRQQEALQQLLVAQRDPASPHFHKWVTPEEFADRFGISGQDMAALQGWLESEGFTVWHVARSRTFLQFSGTAAQVARTFGTQIRQFEVNGERHYANASNPKVPLAVAGLVSALHGLDDFYPRPPAVRRARSPLGPFYTWGGGAQAMAPADIATIYDIAPLAALGYDGAGQSVAIAGASDIDVTDVALYRSTFGLPAPNVVVEVYGADPGTISSWFDEANLDLDIVSAVAPQATIYFVISANAWNAVISAVDNNYAPVLSMSFGSCEPQAAGWASTVRGVAQQANAEGITMVASSGDSGAASCDAPGASSASLGLAVNLPASIPEVTGVGGTEFNGAGGAYWSNTNGATGGSALSYVPEVAWSGAGSGVAGTGGGVSVSFPGKPAWQVAPGVPNDGARDVPDVSFDASPANVGYAVAENGALSTANGQTWGGTSASAPLFAGVVALLNQYLVNTGGAAAAGLGNVNPRLYSLAQTTTNVFHDITQGDNIVPCAAASAGCGPDQTMGYSAGPGYDPVTGLGTIDVYNLFLNWVSNAPGAPALSGLSPSTVAAGGAGFELTVNGANFVSGSTVHWGATALATSYVSSTRLTAPVAAGMVAGASATAVTVTNPGGTASAAITFTVTSAGPSIGSLSPSSAPAGSPAFQLAVMGANFAAGATVHWGATALSTSFVDSTRLTASVPAALVAGAGPANITVANPGGAVSGPSSFLVTAAQVPAISALTPNAAASGSAPFLLTVDGAHFVSGASVYWGTSPLTTTFVSASRLTAMVPAELVATPGSASVTAQNPGGAASAAASFAIAGPVISLLSPNTVAAGAAPFTLNVTGSGFASGALVKWGSMVLTTTWASPGKLMAAVPAALVASPAAASLTVTNPGGALSAAATFTVTAQTTSVLSISPTAAAAGSSVLLSVYGRDFVAGATIFFGVTGLNTTFVNAGTLTANVPATLLAAPGNVTVAVAMPGGSTTAAPSFSVVPPAIGSVTPNAVAAGAACTLTVTGSSFVAGSKVYLGATALTTSFAGSSLLKATVPANLIPSPGSFTVSVSNSASAASNAAALTVITPTPSITTLSPRTAIHGGPGYTLTVTGYGFVTGAVVEWKGAALSTVFVNPAKLTATIPAGLISSRGPAQISVINPGGQAAKAYLYMVQ